MPKDIHVPARIVGGKIPVKASLGQTVIVKEGPEKYTPAPITPTESQQTIPTKDKQLTADVVVEPIPSEYIIPTGTEEITVTENGTVSRDVTSKETVTVNVDVPIPPGYIVPTGNLGITENGQYDITEKASVTVDVPAPVPTGTKEITIAENGEKIVDVGGFAFAHILTSVPVPQGGLEYEQGTYEPTEDAESPVIRFTNQHDEAPSIIVFADVSDSLVGAGNKMTMFIYVDFESLFGKPMLYTRTVKRSTFYTFSRLNGSGAVGTTTGEYDGDGVTQSSFTLYDGKEPTIYGWARTGQTYKWIAIWT